jgi:hypothetical protein
MVISVVGFQSASAGLYESGEPYEFVPKDGKVAAHSFDHFRIRLSDLRGIAVNSPQPSSLRQKYIAKRDELSPRFRRLSAPELDVLGACDYRLYEADRALDAWLEASRRDRSNFAAYSNLALLKLATGDLREARLRDADARSIQPHVLPGMNKEQSDWYLKVEGHLRQLMKNRLAESGKGIAPDQLLPDDLFGVQFVGDGGGYQAGQIAAAEQAKLPDDAIAIVQQLMFWLPHDARLQWLLAEQYNAEGDPGSALTLLNECVEAMRFHPVQLREHQRALQQYFDELRMQEEQRQQDTDRQKRETFWGVVLAGTILVVGLVGWQLRIMLRRVFR